MPDFLYRAKTTTGENASGTISAANYQEALGLLAQQSLFPMDVRDQGDANPWKWQRRAKVKTETIADTLGQLADLLSNGVSLLESLKILADQTSEVRMKEVLTQVHDSVADGVNLDQALTQHPDVFSNLTVNMVRAGLEGAFLEEALERIATFLRRQDEIRSKVIGAMTYPMILGVVGTIVAVVLIVFVVPMFESFFDRLQRNGNSLPMVTVILLALSHGIVRYGLVLIACLGGMVWGIRYGLRQPRGRRLADKWKLKLPVMGKVFHDSAVSRFCRVLGTLLRNGVPILKSLDISSASAGNVLLQETIQNASEHISAGHVLSKPLAESGLIPPQIMAMIRVAEESNSLDQVLVKISDRMDQKLERRLDVMVRLIEPLMLLLIGGMVMFVIMGVLLPIFDLNSSID